MPRPRDETPLPPHEAIVCGPYLSRYQGRSRMMADLRCPRCQIVRARPAAEVRNEVKRDNFQGYCRTCALAAVGEGTHRWEVKRRQRPNRETAKGYLNVLQRDVPDDLLPMYRAMQRSGQPVLGHRWAMAIHLGRALTSNEMVDHMNGQKHDNRPANLRLYVRGKQQPGSCPGHGTYYDEWQQALARVRELEALLPDFDMVRRSS